MSILPLAQESGAESSTAVGGDLRQAQDLHAKRDACPRETEARQTRNKFIGHLQALCAAM